MEEIIESSVNAGPVVSVEPQTVETTQTAVNAEETGATTPIVEKPVQSAEENAKYAAIRREAEQKAAAKAKDEMISEMYGKSHNIHTYAEYQAALAAQEEQKHIQELAEEKGIPEEVAQKLYKAESELNQYKSKETQMKEYTEFFEQYPDVKPEDIPEEVLLETDKGRSLVDAYAKYETKQLKAKLAEYEKGAKTAEVNANNAKTTTGSLAGNGLEKTPTYTREQVEAMPMSEIMKNYDAVMASQKNWK